MYLVRPEGQPHRGMLALKCIFGSEKFGRGERSLVTQGSI